MMAAWQRQRRNACFIYKYFFEYYFKSNIIILLREKHTLRQLKGDAHSLFGIDVVNSSFRFDRNTMINFLFVKDFFGSAYIYSNADTALAGLLWFIAGSKLRDRLLAFLKEMLEKGHSPRKIMFWLRCVDLERAGIKKSALAEALETSRQNIYRWDKYFKACEQRRRVEEKKFRKILKSKFNGYVYRAKDELDLIKLEVAGVSKRKVESLGKKQAKPPSKRQRTVRGRVRK